MPHLLMHMVVCVMVVHMPHLLVHMVVCVMVVHMPHLLVHMPHLLVHMVVCGRLSFSPCPVLSTSCQQLVHTCLV